MDPAPLTEFQVEVLARLDTLLTVGLVVGVVLLIVAGIAVVRMVW